MPKMRTVKYVTTQAVSHAHQDGARLVSVDLDAGATVTPAEFGGLFEQYLESGVIVEAPKDEED